MLLLPIFQPIRGDVDANMQGIKSGIPFSHLRTRDTCVASSYPTMHLVTAITHLVSYITYFKIIKPNRNNSWRFEFALISLAKGTLASKRNPVNSRFSGSKSQILRPRNFNLSNIWLVSRIWTKTETLTVSIVFIVY